MEIKMKKRTKKWLAAAAVLTVTGVVLFIVSLTINHWDFTNLNTVESETNIYEIRENFSSLSLDTDTADILFAVSDDGSCRVECYENKNAKHSVTVQDDTLVIRVADNRAWYEYIGFNFSAPRITLYLPKTAYTSLWINEHTGNIRLPKDFTFRDAALSLSTGNVSFYASVSDKLKIKTSTGSILVENMSADALELTASTGRITVSDVTCGHDIAIQVSTGEVSLTDVTCENIVSAGSTGSMSLAHVIATGTFSLRRSTGSIKFDRSDAAEIFVATDTGSVTGTLLTDKVFITQSDAGHIDVPKATSGGRCEIQTDTGDIKIKTAVYQ